jgi:phosphoribosylformylglycinamidine synthase
MDIKDPNDSIYIVGYTFRELGGSEYYKLRGSVGKNVPKVRLSQAKKIFRAITKAIDAGLVKACHDLSEGGLAVAAAEMAFAGGYGVELHQDRIPLKTVGRNDDVLFSESNSRFLVEVSAKAKEKFETVMKGVAFAEIGKVTRNSRFVVHGLTDKIVVDLSIEELKKSWKRTLSSGV